MELPFRSILAGLQEEAPTPGAPKASQAPGRIGQSPWVARRLCPLPLLASKGVVGSSQLSPRPTSTWAPPGLTPWCAEGTHGGDPHPSPRHPAPAESSAEPTFCSRERGSRGRSGTGRAKEPIRGCRCKHFHPSCFRLANDFHRVSLLTVLSASVLSHCSPGGMGKQELLALLNMERGLTRVSVWPDPRGLQS